MENLTLREQELLEYLRQALPEADRISLKEEQLLKVIRHALRVRRETPWGDAIPEDIFRAFVVFPRINNEDPVFYHQPLWETLKPRIAGKSMHDAVIEINYWTAEVATYQSTDGRTANALTVIARAYGRCGEESVLLVSALRASGIPARQIYVPRWAHCDDNHAWVEAWIGGQWFYLGACEPEPVLNSGWFTSAASKAMLVHTHAYGMEPEGDRIENRVGNAAVINRIEAYAPARLLTVKVVRDGKPAPGLRVRFELANAGEFYAINTQTTDEEGAVRLLTGQGTLRVHVHDEKRYRAKMVNVAEQDTVRIDFSDAVDFVREQEAFVQRPPMESRIQPSEFSDEVFNAHRKRLARCDELRAAREAGFSTENHYYKNARGNFAQLKRFLDCERFAEADKTALLDTLREKDFVDFQAETLFDALETALPYRDRYPFEVWKEGVLCPRVHDEMLLPIRRKLRDALKGLEDAQSVWKLLTQRIRICEMMPATLIPDLWAVWEKGRASRQVLDVLYVAAARSLGIAARLNPASDEKEFYQDGWQALTPAKALSSRLVLVNGAESELIYSTHFSVALLEEGTFKTLEWFGEVLKDRMEIPVRSGQYRVTTCTRQIDGSIDGLLIPVEIGEGETVEVTVEMREDRTREKLLHEALPAVQTRQGVLPEIGVPSVIALLDPGAEPTEHLLNELIEVKEELEGKNLKIALMIEEASQIENEKLRLVLETVKNVELYVAPDRAALLEWRRLLRAGDLRLPLAVAVNEKGEGLFAYTNYCVGSVRSLLKIVTVGD